MQRDPLQPRANIRTRDIARTLARFAVLVLAVVIAIGLSPVDKINAFAGVTVPDQSESTNTGRCSGGICASLVTEYRKDVGSFAVTAVLTSEIPSRCLGRTLSATIVDRSGTGFTGTVVVTSRDARVTLAQPMNAQAVSRVNFAIPGCASSTA